MTSFHGRRRSGVAAIIAMMLVSGCQLAPVAGGSVSGSEVAEPRPSPGLADLTPAASPMAMPSPTARPTPRPVPTPVAPSQALAPAATALETKLAAFRTALRQQDVSGALKNQRELLATATEADASIRNDKSPQAQAVRGAIADIRAAIGGDTNGLDHADAALRQIIGGSDGTIVQLTSDTSMPGGVVDLHTLDDDVRSLRQSIQSKNAGEALRLQAKLVEEIGPLQRLAASDPSAQGKALNDALGLLQKGIAGDEMSLATAIEVLDRLGGAGSEAASTPNYAGLAASLAAKMDAFSTAAATASQSDLLRLQQEILNEATQDEAALGADHSPQAVALRNAINSARASASGDLSKLEGARSDLGKVSGEAAAPGTSSARPISDIKGFAYDLDSTIGAFQDALLKNDTGSMLRLQKSLADQADEAESSLKTVQSKPAQQVLAAVDSVRAAFAGDTSKLADARVQLKQVASASGSAARPAAVATSGPQARSGFDAQQAAGGVVNSLTALSQAAQDPHLSADELAKKRDTVNAEATKAENALQGVTDPRADQIRRGLTAAREAAAGDNAKAQSALNQLQGALNSR